MRIAAASLLPYRLPLCGEWLSAAGGFAQRAGWLLAVRGDDARCGYGDCAPLPGLPGETAAAAALDDWCRRSRGQRVDDALAQLAADAATPAARCAIETALLDLQAQAAGQTLRAWLLATAADERRQAPPLAADELAVNAVLGALAPGRAATLDKAVADALRAGFTILKLKVGIAAPALDSARLRALGAGLPGHISLRLDANGAWNEADAALFLAACAGLPIDSVEEPLAAPDSAALARLQQRCAWPLAVDESWPKFAAASEAFFAAPPVRRLVIKPPRLGGLLPSLALARRAAAAGLAVVVTSSVDSACGVLAAAQLAAAIDAHAGARPAHGLATSAWLAADTGAPPAISAGRLRLPAAAGLGFTPLPAFTGAAARAD